MKSKITISTTEKNSHLFSQLENELDIKKRLKSIEDGKAKIISFKEFDKATSAKIIT